MFLAKAIYDNVADSPEELAFRRGDVVNVHQVDTEGLDGWWLCSLRGKKGIAPGNRLKVVAGMAQQGIYQVPTSHADVFNSLQKKAVTAHKNLGSSAHSQLLAMRSMQDYDVPPARYTLQKQCGHVRSTADEPNLTYDTPKSSKLPPNHRNSRTEDYDSPISLGQGSVTARSLTTSNSDLLCANDSYSVPHSNRSSTVSMLSTGSSMLSSMSPSNEPSARSSMDISAEDMYDIPPPTRAVLTKMGNIVLKEVPPPSLISTDIHDRPLKLRDISSGMLASLDGCDYDTPRKHISLNMEDYATPRSDKSWARRSGDSGDSGIDTSKLDQIYDILQDCSPLKQQEAGDIYDTPRRSTPIKQGLRRSQDSQQKTRFSESIYDVPPQVTKDSSLQMLGVGGDKSLDANRVSTCSTDSQGSDDVGPIDFQELPLDLHAAMDRLLKLHQDVHSSTSKLLSLVSSSWRLRENLEVKLYDVKEACTSMSSVLHEVVEFGQGALANSVHAEDKKLTRKLYYQLEPLQNAAKVITESVKGLNSEQWSIAKLERSNHGSTVTLNEDEDDLDVIIKVTKDIPATERSLASLIQGNSTLLFQKSASPLNGKSPTSVSNGGSTGGESEILSPKTKAPPPIHPKPQLTPEQRASIKRKKSMQERPLPLLPTNHSSVAESVKDSQGENIYNVPKGEMDLSNAYNSQEYDYVSLTRAKLGEKDKPQQTEAVHVSPARSVQTLSDKVEEDPNYDQLSTTRVPLVTESELLPPNVRTSGISPKFKDKIEALQLDAAQKVEMHTEFDTYDTPPGMLPGSSERTGSIGNNSCSRRHSQLHERDRQIMVFYASQLQTHTRHLVNAADAFSQCMDYNQPPKVFIAHSKFVILAAHKLVYIGDTITRNVMSDEVRSRVLATANHLCELLKLAVTATKAAALEWPARNTCEEMTGRVRDVLQAAGGMRDMVTEVVS